jgi:hypothetical protein
MTLPPELLGERQRVTRKEAALQQIHMAIRLLASRDFACAITLALAAEDRIPSSDAPDVFSVFKAKAPPEAINQLNEVRNWLKHDRAPEAMDLFEFEVFVALARAASRFNAAYRETTDEIEGFIQWAHRRGLTKAKGRA